MFTYQANVPILGRSVQEEYVDDHHDINLGLVEPSLESSGTCYVRYEKPCIYIKKGMPKRRSTTETRYSYSLGRHPSFSLRSSLLLLSNR